MEIKLQQLTLDNIELWPITIKIIIVAIIFFAIVFLGYWLNIKTQITQLKVLKKQQRELLKTIQLNSAEASLLKNYQQQLTEINNIYKKFSLKLPAKGEISMLLDNISNIGINNGLTFISFNPEPEIKKTFYAELPIEISLAGNYHQLGEFVSEIEKLKFIITLDNFTLTAISVHELKSFSQIKPLSQQLLYTVIAKIYYIK